MMTELFEDLKARGIAWEMRSVVGGVFIQLSHGTQTIARCHGVSAYEALVGAMLSLDWRKYRPRRAA